MSKLAATDEQKSIIHSSANRLVINAFAGSGKTTTLIGYACARPKESLIYLAFNRAIKEEAVKKFPKNVRCLTTHGLAYKDFGVPYKDKLGNPKPASIAKMFKCSFPVADSALKTLNAYLCSSDKNFDPEKHLIHSGLSNYQAEIAFNTARDIWKQMQDTKNVYVRMPHDGYLKLYQLSNPVLNLDNILVDEAQDSSDVVLDFIERQKGRKIYIGDDHQCLIHDTQVSRANGEYAAIQNIKVGDQVKTVIGTGKIGQSTVLQIFKKKVLGQFIKITLSSGKEIISTPEHTHFADFIEDDTKGNALIHDTNSVRNITIVLCGGTTGNCIMHRLFINGCDPKEKKLLEDAGLPVRLAKNNGWRIEKMSSNYGELEDLALKINTVLGKTLTVRKISAVFNKTLRMLPANHVAVGMSMLNEHCMLEDVVKVEQIQHEYDVYDLNIDKTHNFIANGIVTHNCIYGFKGAVNVMNKVAHDEKLSLTSSFRFGSGIATLATLLLKDWKGEMATIKGLGKHATTFSVNETRPHTVLARTNSGLFDAAVKALQSGHPFGYIGGYEGYRLDMILDAWRLKENMGGVSDPTILLFKSFTELEGYAEAVDDKELKMLIRVIDKYSHDIPKLIDDLKNKSARELTGQEIVLTTAHKAKGMEFNSVVLLDDYADLEVEVDEGGQDKVPSHEDINILYVAATRAIMNLKLNEKTQRWLEEIDMMERVEKGFSVNDFVGYYQKSMAKYAQRNK